MIVGVQSMDKYLQGAPVPAADVAVANSRASPSSSSTAQAGSSSVSSKELALPEKVHLNVDLRELGSRESDSEGEGDQDDEGAADERGAGGHDKVTAVMLAEPEVASPARKRHKGPNESELLLSREDTAPASSRANFKSSATIGTESLFRKQTVKCPVCEAVVKGGWHQINLHVDACVSGTGKKTIGQFFGKLNK